MSFLPCPTHVFLLPLLSHIPTDVAWGPNNGRLLLLPKKRRVLFFSLKFSPSLTHESVPSDANFFLEGRKKTWR